LKSNPNKNNKIKKISNKKHQITNKSEIPIIKINKVMNLIFGY